MQKKLLLFFWQQKCWAASPGVARTLIYIRTMEQESKIVNTKTVLFLLPGSASDAVVVRFLAKLGAKLRAPSETARIG